MYKTMTADRIKEIQKETGYPDSVSIQQALLKVWNECEQEHQSKLKSITDEMIEKKFPTSGNDIMQVYNWEENEKRQQGVKWLKHKLLNK